MVLGVEPRVSMCFHSPLTSHRIVSTLLGRALLPAFLKGFSTALSPPPRPVSAPWSSLSHPELSPLSTNGGAAQQQEIPKDKRVTQARSRISEGCGGELRGCLQRREASQQEKPESLNWNKDQGQGPSRTLGQVNSPWYPWPVCKNKLMGPYVHQIHQIGLNLAYDFSRLRDKPWNRNIYLTIQIIICYIFSIKTIIGN